MRPAIAAFVGVSFLVLGLAIAAAGKHAASLPQRDDDAAAPAPSVLPDAAPAHPPAESQAMVVPEEPSTLEREEARPPLSELAQPPPPKQEVIREAVLHRPVATAAGLIEAKGYTISLSGAEIVRPGETCSFAGRTWPCGTVARTEFRSFLRGRSVTCKLPSAQATAVIASDCRVGNEDVAAWLVENGWARAAADGPYAEIGRRAEAQRRGVFGAPPVGLQ